MSFTAEAIKSVSDKIVLFEIDINLSVDDLINYDAGIYYLHLRRDPDHSSTFTLFGTYAAFNVSNRRYNIQSCDVGGLAYTEYVSYAGMAANEESFYFDSDNQIIYIHATDGDHPFIHGAVRLGEATGFSNKVNATTGSSYYNDLEYQARIVSIPALTKSKDPLFYGIIRYTGGSIVLNNDDGGLDDWEDYDLFGQASRLKLGFPGLEYSEFRDMFTGFGEDFVFNWHTFTVNIQDKRKKLSRSIPIRTLNKTEFSGMDDKYVDKPKRLAYGVIRNAEAICVDQVASTSNGTTTAGGASQLIDSSADFVTDGVTTSHYAINLDTGVQTTISSVAATILVLGADIFNATEARYAVYSVASFTFFFMDTTDHNASAITQVYANKVPISTASTSLTAGTFTVNLCNILESADKIKDVTLDFTGSTIDNGLDVIADIMSIYADEEYTSANYNTTEWAAETALAPDIGLCIDKDKKINEIIEEISISLKGIFLVQDDGLYTFRTYDVDRTVTKTIQDYEWIDEPQFAKPSTEFLTSIKINYNKDQSTDSEYLSVRNTDYEDDLFKQFGVYAEKEFNTVLVSSANANTLAAALMDRVATIGTIVTRKTKMQNYDVDIMDFIVANHKRKSATPVWKVWEIIGRTISLHPVPEIIFTMKYVKEN